MPWNEVTRMDQKMEFVADVLRGTLTISELCRRYNISRKTGYRLLDRYSTRGPAGIEDQSRRPHSCPHQTPREVEELIVEARHRHPTWGPKKLLRILSKRKEPQDWPARSTMCGILLRNGLIEHKRRRRTLGHPGKPTTETQGPNDLWCVDFKGQFRMGNGIYCYPLTVTDNHSRMLLACQGLLTTACADAKPVFRRVFQEYGLPLKIRSDNGVPFATTSLARLSMLSAWWIRLGIRPELIEPGKPQQNGKHERMHKTLKAEATRPPAASLRSQQRKFDVFRQEYSHERPHESLDQETPASLYQPSPRPYPSKLPRLEYPAHYEKRLVSDNGGIRWKCAWVNVSSCCASEYVGLEEIDDGVWEIYFGPVKLGRLLEEHLRIEDQFGKLKRLNR